MNTKKRLARFGAVAVTAFSLAVAANAQDAEGKVKIGDAEGKAKIDLPDRDKNKDKDLDVKVDVDRDRTLTDAGANRHVGAAKFNKATGLTGMEVRNHQNEKLGNVTDLVFDLNSGKISYVVLGVGGFLGIGEKLIAVPPSAFAVGVDDNYVLLNADKVRIQNAPGFVKTDWPSPRDWRGNDYWKDIDVGGTSSVDTGRGTRAEVKTSVNNGPKAEIKTEVNRNDNDKNLRDDRNTRNDRNFRSGEARDTEVFRGRVTSVNPEKRTITVDSEGGSRTFTIDNQAALQVRNQKATSLTDFKVGQYVTVQYHGKSGDYTADHVMTTTVEEPK